MKINKIQNKVKISLNKQDNIKDLLSLSLKRVFLTRFNINTNDVN